MGTQTTDSVTTGMKALVAMETHAAQLSAVTTRLLTEYAEGLPQLLAVHPEANPSSARLSLQPRTAEDARQWAAALDVPLTVSAEDAGEGTGTMVERAAAEFTVDGVAVRLGSCQWHTADEWAARTARAVAA